MNFDEYQQAAAETAIYPRGINYAYLGLAGEAGEVCELAKKVARDDDGEWSDERRAMLRAELGDVLWYVAAIARDHGLKLGTVAAENIAKLRDRKARGVIGGSGDDR